MYGRQTSLAGDPNAIEEQKALQTAIAGLREAAVLRRIAADEYHSLHPGLA